MPVPLSDWKHPAIIGVMRSLLLREAAIGIQPLPGYQPPATLTDLQPDLLEDMPDHEKMVYAAVNERSPAPVAIHAEGGEELIAHWRLKGQGHLKPATAQEDWDAFYGR